MRNIDQYTEEYMKEDFESYQVEYRRKKVLERIQLYNPKSILEIGCGLEPIFKFLPDKIKYTIIEPSRVFAENARNLAVNGGFSNVNVICNYCEDIAIKGDYDFILCSGLLHEVEKPGNLLKSIWNICNNNTVVHCNVPNVKSLHRLIAEGMNENKDIWEKSERNIKLQQHTNFSIETLSNMVENYGFQVKDKGSYFIKPFTHDQMLSMMKENIINENVLEGLYEISKYLPEFGSEIFVEFEIKS